MQKYEKCLILNNHVKVMCNNMGFVIINIFTNKYIYMHIIFHILFQFTLKLVLFLQINHIVYVHDVYIHTYISLIP